MKKMKIIYIFLFICILQLTAISAQAQSFMNAAEKDAFTDVSNGRYITARNKAEKCIQASPESIGASYVMALVFWEGEGNLLRALVLLKKAISSYEAQYCDKETGIPSSSTEQMWHQRMLRELAKLYSELDNRKEEIEVRERLSQLYQTPLNVDAVWGLMKLDRFEEAERIARETIVNNNGEDYWVDMAYNDLTAIADARHEHAKAYEESLKSVSYHAGRSCVVLMNHARSLIVSLRLEEAIAYLQKAQKVKEQDCVSSPYNDLALIYLWNGEWQRAISAMLKVRKKSMEPRLYAQTEAVTRGNLAELYYLMGFGERAWEQMKTVVEAPQRLGYDSILKEQLAMVTRMEYYAILKMYLQRLDEHIGAWTSYRWLHHFDFLGRFDIFRLFVTDESEQVAKWMTRRKEVRAAIWSAHQETFKDALDIKNLKSLFVPGYILWPPFNYVVVDVLGRRTASFLLDYQERSLTPEEASSMHPMFEHIRAYIAWRDGNLDEAKRYISSYREAKTARVKLSDEQINLIEADIFLRENKREEAYLLMDEVYRVYPALFRQFDIRLPVRFERAEDALSQEAIRLLKRSERVEEVSDAPFSISVKCAGERVQICLNTKQSLRYACSSLNDKDYDAAAGQAIALPEIVDQFHHVLFTPRVDISQSDLHSLDGSAVQISADEALNKLLKISHGRIDNEDE